MSGVSLPRQGGDLRGRSPVQLDLSTCVNPYGPPDAVLEALRGMPAEAVRVHPYAAAGDVESAYAEYTGLAAAEFVAGRGTSELIWSLAHHLGGKTVGLPLPSYTEFRQAFPQAQAFGGGPSTHGIDMLDQAMRTCDVVVLSNPHNPTGQVIPRNDLVDIALRYPASLLVVDESYIDFLAEHAAMTMAGCQFRAADLGCWQQMLNSDMHPLCADRRQPGPVHQLLILAGKPTGQRPGPGSTCQQ